MKVRPNIKLKTTLLRQGITQRDLAFGSNIDESRVSKIVKGYEVPTYEMKESIANFLRIKAEKLFE